jgi:dCMP deaminase
VVATGERGGRHLSGKHQDYLSWEQYFMAVAMLSAQRSKDPNTQVGR